MQNYKLSQLDVQTLHNQSKFTCMDWNASINSKPKEIYFDAIQRKGCLNLMFNVGCLEVVWDCNIM